MHCMWLTTLTIYQSCPTQIRARALTIGTLSINIALIFVSIGSMWR